MSAVARLLIWGELAACALAITAPASAAPAAAPAPPAFASHPPLRPLPVASKRALGAGPARFVDAARGDDRLNDGTQRAPWKTINHALLGVHAGDTLYLRGGVYFENVYVALAGTAGKPITIRSYPGEIAVIDGGLAEFEQVPAAAWEPAPGGAPGEYRSTRVYPNIRDVLGSFGDSNVGLQTYWYRSDLQATNELWIASATQFVEPVYVGPGLWYDKQDGRLYARLAHTALKLPAQSGYTLIPYAGETDPRKLPLVVAPYNSTPLFVDQAMHVRFEDLVFRGGGRTTVDLVFGVDIVFDHCLIYAGNYGISAKGTGPLTLSHSGIFGMIAPWMFRTENVSYAYSPSVYPPFVGEQSAAETPGAGKQAAPKVVRHIARLPTHALLVTEGGYEHETFYYPLNHDWDVSYCEFTDGHDGVYLSGRQIRFHHNLVDNMQDDGVYVSSPTPYVTDGLYIYQNLIRQAVDGFGAHARGGPGGKVYIYRNVIDLRAPLQFERPTPEKPQGGIVPGSAAWVVHNPDHIIHMEDIYMYQNTVLSQVQHPLYSYASGMVFAFDPHAERRVFNNLFVYVGGMHQYPVAWGFKRPEANLVLDGNLHWNADASVSAPADYFASSRQHPLSLANKKYYPDGWDAHSLVADPRFVSFTKDGRGNVDLRLRPDSPALRHGVALAPDWPDPLRQGAAAPDIGAFPGGGAPLRVGIDARVTAGSVR